MCVFVCVYVLTGSACEASRTCRKCLRIADDAADSDAFLLPAEVSWGRDKTAPYSRLSIRAVHQFYSATLKAERSGHLRAIDKPHMT